MKGVVTHLVPWRARVPASRKVFDLPPGNAVTR
jgi:hypothetical protein